MSLTVPETLSAQARDGQVDERAFVECVRESLPAAWAIFARLAEALAGKNAGFAVHAPAHMADAERAQLLRALASNAIRGAVERHFGYALAFQNCHKTGAFRPEDVGTPEWDDFTSPRAQVLQQRPEMVDC